MKKCKNIECNNQTIGKKIYCSLTCRNYYVNKYLRDYSKNGKGLTEEAIKKYNLTPKICQKCLVNISYENRESKYCSRKCSISCINSTRKGIEYSISESGLEILRKSAYKNLVGVNYEYSKTVKIEYEKSPKLCLNCTKPLSYETRNRSKYCCKICSKLFRRKDISVYLSYKQDTMFKFNLSDYPNEFDFSLIEQYGWYAPSNSKKPNIGGVSRDHMLSVREGCNLGLDPKLLAHPANCKLMIHSDNISKHKKSSLTLAELIDKIDKWNIKYLGYSANG